MTSSFSHALAIGVFRETEMVWGMCGSFLGLGASHNGGGMTYGREWWASRFSALVPVHL